ncbi:MAG: serine/threonine-protein kinase, partial [bacterium]
MDERARERWLEIDDAFASALACPEPERDELLARLARGDEDLARSVRSLLASEPLAEAALGESASVFAIPLVQAEQQAGREGDATAVAGTRLGTYRVIAEIGRGGMGAVYLAERADDQFEKRVAIKLVKRGMDTDEVFRRFRYERQILASLEHPNIARLYDGGVSDDGRPYLVMEYIDGQPLDAYCDRLGLTVERRLALFRSACDAVQYAHQNLIVHRDLKPSNILVTPDGTIKLLDFGIAKLLQADVPDDTFTRTEMRAFTPEYASPEQLFGRPATTASDVYGLGVVLHQLLAGRRVAHHDLADRVQTSREQAERPPTRPSDAARAAGMAVAATRGTTHDRLVKRLKG